MMIVINEDMECYDLIWPLTIISDRYHGAYSGAAYVAFPLEYHEVPEFVGGGDVEEREGWEPYRLREPGFVCGFGSTPNRAARDLYKLLASLGELPETIVVRD